jgi:hypothetical protein
MFCESNWDLPKKMLLALRSNFLNTTCDFAMSLHCSPRDDGIGDVSAILLIFKLPLALGMLPTSFHVTSP